MDLLEIPKKGHLLVVVDYYSKWPEIALLTKTDAGNGIKCMKSMFHTHGLPETLRSDSAPLFASREFEGFLEYLSIDHKKGIPYWPQSDGQVEGLNKTLLKAIRIAQLCNRGPLITFTNALIVQQAYQCHLILCFSTIQFHKMLSCEALALLPFVRFKFCHSPPQHILLTFSLPIYTCTFLKEIRELIRYADFCLLDFSHCSTRPMPPTLGCKPAKLSKITIVSLV